MFLHNFKYTFKVLLNSKSLIFWTFAFPILLGIFFNMAFSDIENSEKVNIIDIAIVDNLEFNNKENEAYKETFSILSSNDNKDRLFNIKYVSLSDASKLLNDKKVVGYIEFMNNDPILNVRSSGVNETIIKSVLEEIKENKSIIDDLLNIEVTNLYKKGNTNIDYDKIINDIVDLVNSQKVNLNDTSLKNLDYTMIEFYTLIAMSCLYGGIIGMTSINSLLPNMGSKGKRISVSPILKRNIILSSVIASYIIQLIGVFIIFAFTYFVLNIDYGSNWLLVMLMIAVGSFCGLSLGIAISSLINKDENSKTGIVIGITMLFCFLSGMMGISMKYIIDKNFPIINKLNPASMITDGFYAMYRYEGLDRYWFNIISLLIFSLLMIIISSISLRRKKYDSI